MDATRNLDGKGCSKCKTINRAIEMWNHGAEAPAEARVMFLFAVVENMSDWVMLKELVCSPSPTIRQYLGLTAVEYEGLVLSTDVSSGRANPQNVSTRISLRWSNYLCCHSVGNTENSFPLTTNKAPLTLLSIE